MALSRAVLVATAVAVAVAAAGAGVGAAPTGPAGAPAGGAPSHPGAATAAAEAAAAAAAAARQYVFRGAGGGVRGPASTPYVYRPPPRATVRPTPKPVETPALCWEGTGRGGARRYCCWVKTPCGTACATTYERVSGSVEPVQRCRPRTCGGRVQCGVKETPVPTGGVYTVAPTATPTASATAAPTASPTGAPTASPTAAPTASPTTAPTASPTAAPTASPTAAPTASPTAAPTASPTAAPTASPTSAPTASPTSAPTASPTSAPTASPTAAPTASPTAAPTTSPTAAPTASPTAAPTTSPTAVPTASPTAPPTASPTASPTPTAAPWSFGDGWTRCTAANSRVRKEIRDLTPTERTAFTTAFRTFYDSGGFQQFTTVHLANAAEAHGGSAFLPWHRYFLIELEDALRSIDPSVVLPYWDWSLDAADPARSPVWSTNLLGGATPGGCIPDGPFANLQAPLPTPHCVRRGFTARVANGMSGVRFEEPAVIAQLVGPGTSFVDFVDAWEFAHGGPHVAIGGAALTSNFGDMFFISQSPQDPAFFLHHAYVDKVWADRQANNNPTDYAGTQNGRTVAATDNVPPFGLPVSLTFSVPCVTYAAPTTRSALPSRGGRTVGRGTAEAVVAEEGDAKLNAMEQFALANGVSQERVDAAKDVLIAADVEATVVGLSVASAEVTEAVV